MLKKRYGPWISERRCTLSLLCVYVSLESLYLLSLSLCSVDPSSVSDRQLSLGLCLARRTRSHNPFFLEILAQPLTRALLSPPTKRNK